MFHNFKNTLHYQAKKSTRAFGPRCVKAESLGPEGSMIRYGTKKKRTKNINLTSSIFRASAPKNSAIRVFRIS